MVLIATPAMNSMLATLIKLLRPSVSRRITLMTAVKHLLHMPKKPGLMNTPSSVSSVIGFKTLQSAFTQTAASNGSERSSKRFPD